MKIIARKGYHSTKWAFVQEMGGSFSAPAGQRVQKGRAAGGGPAQMGDDQPWINFSISSTVPSMPRLAVLTHRSFHSAAPHLRSVWKL